MLVTAVSPKSNSALWPKGICVEILNVIALSHQQPLPHAWEFHISMKSMEAGVDKWEKWQPGIPSSCRLLCALDKARKLFERTLLQRFHRGMKSAKISSRNEILQYIIEEDLDISSMAFERGIRSWLPSPWWMALFSTMMILYSQYWW